MYEHVVVISPCNARYIAPERVFTDPGKSHQCRVVAELQGVPRELLISALRLLENKGKAR